jgi:hypothetical protein
MFEIIVKHMELGFEPGPDEIWIGPLVKSITTFPTIGSA